MNLRDEHQAYKSIIGQVILDVRDKRDREGEEEISPWCMSAYL